MQMLIAWRAGGVAWRCVAERHKVCAMRLAQSITFCALPRACDACSVVTDGPGGLSANTSSESLLRNSFSEFPSEVGATDTVTEEEL